MHDIDLPQSDAIQIASGIVVAFVSNNSLRASELGELIVNVHAAVAGLAQTTPIGSTAPDIDKPTAAQIRRSIRPDALISFVDGKPYKTLKRHLGTNGLDFDAYRARYGLPSDYPTVAPNYSAARSALAKELGLGQQRTKSVAQPEANAASAPRGRGRPRKAT